MPGVGSPGACSISFIDAEISVILHSNSEWSVSFSSGIRRPDCVLARKVWSMVDHEVSVGLHSGEVFSILGGNETVLSHRLVVVNSVGSVVLSEELGIWLISSPGVGRPCGLVVPVIKDEVSVILHDELEGGSSLFARCWTTMCIFR